MSLMSGQGGVLRGVRYLLTRRVATRGAPLRTSPAASAASETLQFASLHVSVDGTYCRTISSCTLPEAEGRL